MTFQNQWNYHELSNGRFPGTQKSSMNFGSMAIFSHWPYFGFWRVASVFPDFFHHFCRLDGLKPAFYPGFCLKTMGKAMGFRLDSATQAAKAEVALHLSNAKASASQELLRQKAEVEAARLELKALHSQVRFRRIFFGENRLFF